MYTDSECLCMFCVRHLLSYDAGSQDQAVIRAPPRLRHRMELHSRCTSARHRWHLGENFIVARGRRLRRSRSHRVPFIGQADCRETLAPSRVPQQVILDDQAPTEDGPLNLQIAADLLRHSASPKGAINRPEQVQRARGISSIARSRKRTSHRSRSLQRINGENPKAGLICDTWMLVLASKAPAQRFEPGGYGRWMPEALRTTR